MSLGAAEPIAALESALSVKAHYFVLLRTEMSAGHGGVSGRYAAWRQRAWELAWIIDCASNPRKS